MQDKHIISCMRITIFNLLTYISLGCIVGCLLVACQNDPAAASTDEPIALVPLQEEYDESNVNWGFIDKSGTVVIEGNYDEVNNFSDGFAAYRQKAFWGYIDKRGQIVIDAQYYNAYNFANGIAKVSNFDRNYGIINRSGEVIIPLKYQDISQFSEGLCAVKKKSKWGYIDNENQNIIPIIYDAAKGFHDGIAIVKKEDVYFLIDQKGIKKSGNFDKISLLNNGTYKIKVAKKYGLINANGKSIIKPIYKSISQIDDKTMAVNLGEDYFLRTLTDEKIEVPKNTGIQYLGADRWSYEQNGKSGILDNEGRVVMAPKYDIITQFSDGFGSYQEGQLWGYLDRDGKKLTPAVFGLTWKFQEGLARCISRDGVGFLNPNGTLEFIARDFDVRDFHEGLARIPIK